MKAPVAESPNLPSDTDTQSISVESFTLLTGSDRASLKRAGDTALSVVHSLYQHYQGHPASLYATA